MASPATSVREWFDERFPLDDLKALAQKKKVPVHRYSYWYFLGGMTLFLFGVQVLTGALLLMYYRPGADEAFESVQFIMTQVQFGWLIRSVHSWSANLLVFMAFRPPFQRPLPEVLPQAARTDVGERHTAAVPDAGFRVQRIPVAMEHAVIFRDQGGHGDTGANPDHRPSHSAVPARRRRHYRQHPDPAVRVSRRDIAGTGDVADRRASGTDSMVRHERAARY